MKLSEQNQELLLNILGSLSKQYIAMAKDLEWRRMLALMKDDIMTIEHINNELVYVQEVASQYMTLVKTYTDFQLS